MNFGEIRKVCLIGGGEPMVHCAQYLIAKGVEVHAILAPRHEDSELPLSGKHLGFALKDGGVSYVCVEDINDPAFIADHIEPKAYDICICFGPAWVFSEAVLAAFQYKMVNFNGIPVPRYLGGAHYTWQILNGDKTSGMTIQHITRKVDQGSVLLYEEQQLSADVRIPQDYFESNYRVACDFLNRFCDALMAHNDFHETPYETLNARRLYFPRLLTVHQAYIDWSWRGEDIEKFCCAFDAPYPGAMSFIKGHKVTLKSAELLQDESGLHPFCSGLVVRKHEGAMFVAVSGGLLKIKDVRTSDSAAIKIREGDRFHTPRDILDGAPSFKPVITSKKPF